MCQLYYVLISLLCTVNGFANTLYCNAFVDILIPLHFNHIKRVKQQKFNSSLFHKFSETSVQIPNNTVQISLQ